MARTNHQLFESHHNVRLVCKDQLWEMRAVSALLSIFPAFRGGGFLKSWWTTYRLPWQRLPIIAYGTNTTDPMNPGMRAVRDHELVHANDMRTFWQLIRAAALYFAFPLPVLFSGRWWFERHAYLINIAAGELTPATAADQLWRFYFWPWPRESMRRWFESKGPF